MRLGRLPCGFALLLTVLAGCGREHSAPAVGDVPALQTLTVTAMAGDGGLAWDGVVQAVEQSILSAQTSGRVVTLGADVDGKVARGELLLRLTDAEQQAAVASAAAQLRAAEAQLTDAAARFDRASELAGRQLIARDDFDRVRAVRDSAVASRDAAAALLAQARQQLDYTRIAAPYAGIIAARHVELGESVAPGRALYTLFAPGQLRLEVLVPQGDAERIRTQPVARVYLADGREIDAARVVVFPAADPQAHSTSVRVYLPSLTAAPRPGQVAKVRFAAATGTATIWLPVSAVVRRGEMSAAYVVDEQGIVMRQLRLGRANGGRLEILAGIAPGEQVALDPQAALAAVRAGRAQAVAGRD